jgi:hypothetical protein
VVAACARGGSLGAAELWVGSSSASRSSTAVRGRGRAGEAGARPSEARGAGSSEACGVGVREACGAGECESQGAGEDGVGGGGEVAAPCAGVGAVVVGGWSVAEAGRLVRVREGELAWKRGGVRDDARMALLFSAAVVFPVAFRVVP